MPTQRGVSEFNLSPGLWVVATPIGNLGDLSPRARAALESADFVLCEDTRETARLLAAAGILRPLPTLERVDAYASEGKLERLVERLDAGQNLALVSDAGTPAISDPGAPLVALARARGIAVTPIPGPSAPVTLLSAAGFGETAFVFRGFFPRKPKEQAAELELAGQSRAASVFIWFESPNRVEEALAAVASRLPEARVIAAKELTKLHERFFSGTAIEVAREVREELAREGARGEWCFAVRWLRDQPGGEVPGGPEGRSEESSEVVNKVVRCLLDAGISASEAARQVSQHFGASRKHVYEIALRLTGKK